MFGRFLLINKKRSLIIVKLNNQIKKFDDLKKISNNSPCNTFFCNKDFEKITDLVLDNSEKFVIYLTKKGRIGIIELQDSQRSNGYQIPLGHPERTDEACSKDSADSTSAKFYSLKISPEDDLLVAISTEYVDKAPAICVNLLRMGGPRSAGGSSSGARSSNYSAHRSQKFPPIGFCDRRVVDRQSMIGEHTSNEFMPQYVNFDIKHRDTNYLLVFLRIPCRFYIFSIFGDKIVKERTQELPAFEAVSKIFVNDGAITGESIYLTMHCGTLLKISFKLE